jgi:type VI secretion system secreted protein VgrG
MANTFRFGFQIDGNEQGFTVARFSGVEGISRLFHFEIFLISDDHGLPYYDELIGQAATLSISRDDDSTFINGMISRFLYLGYSGNTTSYYIELVPALWLLTQRHRSRIFQEKTVLEIMKDVLTEGFEPGYMNYDFDRLRKDYKKRNFCVQYRESDFNFISRLMEEEGIFYNFTHHIKPKDKKHPLAQRNSHTFVLGDHPTCYPQINGKDGTEAKSEEKVKFVNETGLTSDEEHIYNINYNFQIRPGKATLRDHNFRKNINIDPPAYTLSTRFGGLEFYDYPGEFDDAAEGKRLTEVRLQELRTQYELGTGQSNSLRLAPGKCFTLEGHKYLPSKKNLVVKVTHNGRDATDAETKNDWATVFNWIDKGLDPLLSYLPTIPLGPLGSISAQQLYHEYRKGVREQITKKTFFYGNEFDCVPAETYYRPPRLTPKPAIQGPQTAMVVGPGNDKEDKAKKELYMSEGDPELGMAKVQFHWDKREKDENTNCSCWVRVAYNYAGQDHGMQFHPLIGDEVVVDFLEGDPDKPLIVGSVFNGDNIPPLQNKDMTGNVILTPYQHRLMLSDKETSITLNTGGGKDKKQEVLQLADQDPDYGNMILLKTADDHKVRLRKSEDTSGIGIRTEQGHSITLVDNPYSGILLEDKTEKLYIKIDSDTKIITIKNEADEPNKKILIDCQRGNVSVLGGAVNVEGGEVKITGTSSVKIDSSAEVTIQAANIKLEAAMITLDAAMVKCSGVVKCETLITNAVISTSYTPGAGNIW